MTTQRDAAGSSDPLRQTLFIVWGFPEPTQTFIHREMEHVQGSAGDVHVLAGYNVDRDDLSDELASIQSRTLYLGHPARWSARGLAWAARNPRKFAGTMRWAMSLPHRTAKHRARMSAMVLAAASVADEVQARGFTYLHAHFAAYQTELAMCLARFTGVPFGITSHAYDIWRDRNILAEKLGAARVMLTCTDYNAQHLRSIAPEHAQKVHLVYHGLDLERVGGVSPYPAGPRVRWIAIGRLIPKKGFDVLIDALARLEASGADFELVFVGDGPERPRLEALVAQHGLQARVTLRGALPNAEVWRLLRESHALVAPSIRDKDGDIDGIPNVTLEAMATGRPVVGTRLSGIPEVVRDGETGYLADPGDPLQLFEAMRRLGDDLDHAREMGLQARALIEASFDVAVNMATQVSLMRDAQRDAFGGHHRAEHNTTRAS